MANRTNLHSRKVLRENLKKKDEIEKLEEEAEKERQKNLIKRDVKDLYYHQQMMQDAKSHNKSVLDFKQRLHQQQKMEKLAQETEQRKRENSDLKFLKLKQTQDMITNKKQYHDDLKKQKDEKLNSTKLLDKEDYSYKAARGLNAMIPGINNWNTIGSVPLKRGGNSLARSQATLDPFVVTDKPIELPNITSARQSKYQIMKELETEYYNETNGLSKGFGVRRLSQGHNLSQPNLHDINPYIEKEKQKMANDIRQRNHSVRY